MTRLDAFVKTWPSIVMQDRQFTNTAFVREQLDGLLGWWSTAGVDCVVGEESFNWLRPPPAPAARIATTASVAAAAAPPAPGPGWPDSMEAFATYLAHNRDLPESRWPGPRFLPTGPVEKPRLMVILPAPDAQRESDALPMGARAMRLLENMLRAAGLSLADCHIATLSLTAPPGGILHAELIAPLLRRMHHHIGLVAPQALLLVGDQTNRAFAPTNDVDENSNLPFLRHTDGIIACTSILHPRLILEQPPAKAGAWKSLRRLFGGERQ